VAEIYEDKEETMQRRTLYGALVVTVTCFMLLGLSLAIVEARMEQMTGTITAIEPASQTVVVETPMGTDKFTVGGPLSPQAIIKKGGKARQLQDLQVGERVAVAWKRTANGEEIERLDARQDERLTRAE
jgi:hypothetical protein